MTTTDIDMIDEPLCPAAGIYDPVGIAKMQLYDEVGGRSMQSLFIRGPIDRARADELARNEESWARDGLMIALQTTAALVNRDDLDRLRRDLQAAEKQAADAARDRIDAQVQLRRAVVQGDAAAAEQAERDIAAADAKYLAAQRRVVLLEEAVEKATESHLTAVSAAVSAKAAERLEEEREQRRYIVRLLLQELELHRGEIIRNAAALKLLKSGELVNEAVSGATG
jgi:hypothetical protein